MEYHDVFCARCGQMKGFCQCPQVSEVVQRVRDAALAMQEIFTVDDLSGMVTGAEIAQALNDPRFAFALRPYDGKRYYISIAAYPGGLVKFREGLRDKTKRPGHWSIYLGDGRCLY